MPVPDRIKKHLVKKGEVLNPKGKPKGTKNARTIVREFMDQPADKLPNGFVVSRFQFLLWSVYEMAVTLNKQVLYRKREVEQAELELKNAKRYLDDWKIQLKEAEEAYKKSQSCKDKDLVKQFKEVFDDTKKEYKQMASKVEKLKQAIRSRNREYENIVKTTQEQNGKAYESFQKASGQYLEKQEVKQLSTQPLHISVDKEEMKSALEAIDAEL